MSFWMLRFFYNRLHMVCLFKCHHPKTLRVMYCNSKHRRPSVLCSRAQYQLSQAAAIKDIIAKNKTNRIIPNKVCTNNKGFSQSIVLFLYLLTVIKPQCFTIFTKILKTINITRCVNHQNVTNTRQHHVVQWVINHVLFINGNQLLVYGLRNELQASSSSTG